MSAAPRSGPPQDVPRRPEALPKSCRIRVRREFLRIQGQAPRIHGKRLILQLLPARGQESRLGVTITKKVGNAVLRTQLKRWIREAFRRAPAELRTPSTAGTGAPYDLVVIAKSGVVDFSYAAIRDELHHGIARHLQSRPASGGAGKPSRPKGGPNRRPPSPPRPRGDGEGSR